MNTVLVFLANLLTVAAFPAMSVSLLEIGAVLTAVVIMGFALLEYTKPRRQLPALSNTTRRRAGPPRVLTSVRAEA